MLSRALALPLLLTLTSPAAVKLGSVHQIGGSNADHISALTRDSAGNLYIAGRTFSVDFPANVQQLRPGGSNLTRVDANGARITPLFGHAGVPMLAIAAVPGSLLVLTANALLTSADSGDTFAACDPTLPSGSIFGSIAVDGNNVYVALGSYGIFKSTDACATFAPIATEIAPNSNAQYPEQVFVDPNRPATLFATSRFTSVPTYRSDDAGATWHRQSGPHLWNLIFDRAHPGVIYADAVDQTYVSTDGGVAWTQNAPVLAGFGSGGAMPEAVDAQGNLFAADLSIVYFSPDRGRTWTPTHTFGQTTQLAADPASNAVYVLSGDTLYSSTDHFATWQTVEAAHIANIAMLAISRGAVFAASSYITSDAFAAKLDPAGNLIWATYLGGPYDDQATGIAVAPNGDVFVCGSMQTSSVQGGSFVARLSRDGALIYSNVFTDRFTAPQAIAIDAAGNAYVTGTTTSTVGGFAGTLPVTPGAAQSTLLPPSPTAAPEPRLILFARHDAFACKLDPNGVIAYCTYLGNGADNGNAISIDSAGNAYVAGGNTVWKLNPDGSKILYTQTFPGGAISAAAIDGRGAWWIGGSVSVPTFPTTTGAFQPVLTTRPGSTAVDAFVARLDAGTGDLLASTLIGGESSDLVTALVPAPDGAVTIAGMTESRNFPLRAAYQSSFADATAFVARLTADLSTLIFSTYAGDTRPFAAFGIALADDGSVYLAGDTAYPWVPNAVDGSLPPSSDIFVTQLIPDGAAIPDLEAVLNAASREGGAIAPNQIITVVAPGAGQDAAVFIDGTPLPTISSTGGVIVAQVPGDFAVPAAVNLTVQSEGKASAPLLMPGAIAAPAIYTQDGSGTGLGLVFNEDGSLNSKDNPAAQGSVISIACNGVRPDTPVKVYVNGTLADFIDAVSQSLPGLPAAAVILRVRVPAVPDSLPLVSISVNVGGQSLSTGIQSPRDVAIAIR